MSNFKQYGSILLRGGLSFAILLAGVQLISSSSWKLLLDYYLVSNFVMLYPFNMSREKGEKSDNLNEISETATLSRRGKIKEEHTELTDTANELRRKQHPQKKNDLRELLLDFALNFLKYAFLQICAPVIFMQNLLLDEKF
ncbi:hypothetical protein [Liquorilactobacillus satsumensis]|uniref:hypothetical protein n=1 Tax=Liquorilactobacillus satsumensis TaxID=259059 RepID=UPI0039E9FA14